MPVRSCLPWPHGRHRAPAAPALHQLPCPAGHAYPWHDPGGLTLIDAGLPGSAPLIAGAIRQSGYQPADLRRLVLTHFHADHTGAAADIAGWGEAEVLAHHADAPFIRAGAAGPAPDLAGWEQPLYDQVVSQLSAQPVAPPRIDREIGDGDELGFGDGAVAVAVPGHTPGSVALYLPRHRVLFTGDAAARRPDGTVIGGVFNVNRAQAAASLRRLAALDATVACFGHGEPLTHHAAAELQAAARLLPSESARKRGVSPLGWWAARGGGSGLAGCGLRWCRRGAGSGSSRAGGCTPRGGRRRARSGL